jgi:membrane glycosyltransferase
MRRVLFFALNVMTVAGLFAAMVVMMAMGGLTPAEGVMLFAYLLTLPWLSIGFWNGVIGFIIALRAKNPAAFVNPAATRADGSAPITARTAIAMAIRNEDVDTVVDRLEAMHLDLVRSGWGSRFAFHVLSDSTDPAIIAAEEKAIAKWQGRASSVTPIHYRRRTSNEGFKAGNIGAFCAAHHSEYDFFLPLDADSRMSAKAILRLVRIMQASPEIGILQGLVVGSPSKTFFTRAFQFGMRHGMRSYTLGAAWWQGDCGPFWGHNAVIRIKAFHEHCRLPVLPGKGPLSGHIMSHDQVEAVLMRRAGYEVRVLAEEDESFEENPPSLPDFIKRETRWCQGNMQYLKLLGRNLPDLKPTSRVQLMLAILMYVNGPAWFLFITAGAAMAAFTDQFGSIPLAYGLGLFAVIMLFNLTPKLMGMAQSFWQRPVAETYGGRIRIVAGLIGEFLFSTLIAPCVALAITICCMGLFLGKRIKWDAQQRSRTYLSLREAARTLWPQTLYGLTLLAVLGTLAPWALMFGCLIVAPLCLAIPLATGSTLPALGRKTRHWGLFDIPEDRAARLPALLEEPAAAQAA